MKNIVIFKNNSDLTSFLKPKLNKKIGEGSEGAIYTDGVDVYKIFDKDCPVSEFYRDHFEDIITSDDIKLDSFIFPDELYVLKIRLEALKSKLITNNISSEWYQKKSIEILRGVDFDVLIQAYYKMLSDIKELTKEKIVISDLPGNIMFDGTNLYGVDTCFYHRAIIAERIGLDKRNIKQLDTAIKLLFMFLKNDYKELSSYFDDKSDSEKLIRKVKTIVNG